MGLDEEDVDPILGDLAAVVADTGKAKVYAKRNVSGARAMLREVKEKTQQVEELQALLEDAQTELMKKQGQLHDAELSLKDDRERADALKIELGIAQAGVNQYEEVKEKHGYRPDSAKDVLVDQVDQCQREVALTNGEVKKTTIAVKTENLRIMEMEEEMEMLNEHVKAIQQSGAASAAKAQLQEIKDRNEKLATDVQELLAKNEGIREELEKMNHELGVCQREALLHKEEKHKLMHGISDANNRDGLVVEISLLKQKLKDLQAEARTAKIQAMSDSSAEMNAMTTQIKEAQNELAQQRQIRDQHAVEFAEKLQLETREAQKAVSRRGATSPAVNAALEILKKVKDDVEAVQQKIAGAKQDHRLKKTRNDDAEELIEELSLMQRKMLKMQEEKNNMIEENAGATLKIADMQEEICAKLGIASS